MLDDLQALLGRLTEGERQSVIKDALAATKGLLWVPNPGPQTQALFSEADELFYGGQAGGGKSDLIIGAALTQHRNALILRRVYEDVRALIARAEEISGGRYNSQTKQLRASGRVLEFGGCQFEPDKERYKGRPHDLKAFDELSDFTESQYLFICAWTRTTVPGQRTRIIASGNPPTRPEGLWVYKRWGAWLDPAHPRPAEDGELRWYARGPHGEDVEVDGPGVHVIDGEPCEARSRTFIRARLDDNPDLVASGYQATLDALPPELRAVYRDGNFGGQIKDDEYQVIKTAWIQAAMDRWQPDGGKGRPMTCMAIDPAGGGVDDAVIAARHGGWFAPLIVVNGAETGDGSRMAGRVTQYRRDACPIIVDAGGGYGGSVTLRLRDNGVECISYNGAATSSAQTRDGARLKFYNKRAESFWRVREALNPDQPGGSPVILPPDDELKADLAAPRWELTRQGIKIESKEDIKARIGRSPGRGDAVVMALSDAINRSVTAFNKPQAYAPKAVMAYPHLRRR